MKYKIEDAYEKQNIAEELDEALLDLLGSEISRLVENDDRSRQGWLEDHKDWIKLAAQVRDAKNYPWQNASNVKYPLVTIAAMQFHARALPSLINSNTPIRARVVGKDPTGEKLKRANRVSKYMSYQVMEQMEEWLDDMDRLLFILPIVGTCFKKTFFSESESRMKSVMIMPSDLILNYHATDYRRARLSHIMLMDSNEVREYQLQGLFRDVDLNEKSKKDSFELRDDINNLKDDTEEPEVIEVIESHCWLDLDEDGYKEPYIVTFHRDSGEILRIVARWEPDAISYNARGEVSKIEATEYFTPYIFLPDPSSSVYGIGFGRLLGPTNETVNTIINQLIDAGTLSNLQSGFLSRGVKLKGGVARFKPGEWKIVNSNAEDLRKGIVPMPVREPSNVLFNLLGLLIESGQQISSVSDIMMGENPGQNQPATTTMAVLEQGLKVFTGIYKRIHRQLGKEYKKLYKMNGVYATQEEYDALLDEYPPQGMDEEQMSQWQPPSVFEDFSREGLDIVPASDPNIVSDTQRLIKSQSLLEKAAMGLPVNPFVATQRSLEAEGHEDIQQIMQMPEMPPSPDQLEFQLETVKTQIDAFRAYHEALEKVAKAESLEEGLQLNVYKQAVEDSIKVFGLEQQIMQQGAAGAEPKKQV